MSEELPGREEEEETRGVLEADKESVSRRRE